MKNDFSKNLLAAHHRVIKILNQIPEDQKITKDWTKCEIIAHLAGWYEEDIDAIPKILRGEKPISFRVSVNKFNEKSLKNRRNKNLSELELEMKNLHMQLIEQIESLNEKQVDEYFGTYLGKKPINVLWAINETIHHDNEHAKELEKLTLQNT